eukprot:Ihof_evm9s195 gene=Ihof_evmTU9s195
MASSLLFVALALSSWNPASYWQHIGLPPIEYGQIIIMLYFEVSLSNFLSLFCVCSTSFFLEICPTYIFLGVAAFALPLFSVFASVWLKDKTGHVMTMGLTRGEYKLLP